jgi:hypothetical protein
MIFPVKDCDISGRCIEDHSSTGITINDSNGQDVRVFTPSARVYARFFAFADADQMPLRRMEVDWGDGRKYPLDGLFRNYRGYTQPTCNATTKVCEASQIDDLSACSTDSQCGSGKCVLQSAGSGVGKCLVTRQLNACRTDADCTRVAACTDVSQARTFGTITDRTCDNNYAQFEHVYQCTRLPVSQGGNFEPNPDLCGDRRAFPNGCCIFVPKVQVTDNWGWCNGACSGGVGGEGCYDASFKNGRNECGESLGAWTRFKGRIIVAPPALRR